LNQQSQLNISVGTCCAGVYGIGCLKCAGCVVGSVGCAIGTQACYDCTKQNVKTYIKQLQENDPNYDPHDVSSVLNKGDSSTPNKRIRLRDIINYIRTNTNNIYDKTSDKIIIQIFNLIESYDEPYHIFVKHDKPGIDFLIEEAIKTYKKAVGGRKNKRTQRKIKRTTMRKYKLKGKKKIVHTFRKN
jgi:hypothetical protein